MTKHYRITIARVYLSILFIGAVAGCDRLGNSRYAQLMRDADSKSANGDFARAINLYEAALDDSPRCAEIHYKLALLYDDKLSDPVSALHHFKRYIELSPNGPHANEVKKSIKHDEIAALTALSGDSVIPRLEAAQLRNENLNLRKELKRAPDLCAVPQRNRRQTAQALRKPPSRRQTEPTLCGRATRSSPSHENFINRRNVGKRFSRQTEKISATRKSLPSVRPWLFPSKLFSTSARLPGTTLRVNGAARNCARIVTSIRTVR